MRYRLKWIDRSEGFKHLKGMISLQFFCEPIGNWIMCDIKKAPDSSFEKRKAHAEDLAKRSIDVTRRAMHHAASHIEMIHEN